MGDGVVTSNKTGCRIGNSIILLRELHVMDAGYLKPVTGPLYYVKFCTRRLKV